MLKHLYKTAFIALLGVLSFQESFAQCSTKTDLAVTTISPICIGSITEVTIVGSELNKTYEVFNGTTSVSSAIAGTGANLTIPLNALPAGFYSLTIKVSSKGCSLVELTQKAILVINSGPNPTLQVTSNSPVCLGNASIVTIYNSQVGAAYQAFIDGLPVSATTLGTGADLSISIITLSPGNHIITIRASVAGCGIVQLIENVTILVYPVSSYSFKVYGDTICSASAIAKLTITGSSSTIQYQMFRGSTPFLDPFFGDAGTNTTVKNIPTSLLTIGENTITVKATVSTTCQAVVLSANATILVNPPPVYPTPIVIGDTVTFPASIARIRIKNPIQGQTYQAFEGGVQVASPVVGFGEEIELLIPVGGTNGLTVGTHTINIRYSVGGCSSLPLSLQTTILVKPKVTTSIEDELITSNFAVYPNPFSSGFVISSKWNGNLKMIDALGNVVLQQTFTTNEEIKIDPDLKKGLYFLQLESNGKREVTKLVKE